MLSLLLASLLPAAAPAQHAESTRISPDPQVLRAHMRFLADDALEGRRPGTRGGELAARYIAAQFERLGLEPAGASGTYYHPVPIITLTPDPVVRLVGPSPAELVYRDEYVLWSMRNDPVVSLRAGLAYVGYGIVAPEYGWDDYRGADVKGKVVVVLVNDPGLRDSTIFKGRILTYYGRWTYKIEEAARQGAAGILMVHTEESATYPWTTVQSGWTGPQTRLEKAPSSLHVAGWLQEDAAARVFRAGGADLRQLADAASRRSFAPVPLKLEIDASVRSSISRSRTDNVIARLPGRGPRGHQAVLIGGHYDHFGIGTPVNGDSIYNGAEDNASGTAGVLTVAEALVRSGVRPQRSILFMGFTAEESGLLGSEAFVARPTVPLSDLAAILNLDVLNLYGRTRDVSALGLDQSDLGDTFARAARAEGLKVFTSREAMVRGEFFRSDHFPFARAGIPSLSLVNGSSYVGQAPGYGEQKRQEYIRTRYHQPGDEVLPWFSYDGAIQQLRVTIRTALAVAGSTRLPSWKPGSEFRAAGERRLAPDERR